MPDIWMDVDTALSEVPVNMFPLTDDTDFKSREELVAYNAAGMDLVWNFVTTAGAFTQTAVTPTTAGVHDWTNQGNGMYTLEIPASAGTINNDTEGFGWFVGFATGILPWRGPVIGFRAAGLNNALIDNAHSATRGLAGTALPDAAAEAAGGLFTRGTGAGQINQSNNGRIDSDVLSLAANVITATAIQAGAITAAKIAANAITSTEIADGAITAAKLGSGAITADKIAADAITAAKIAASAIGSSELSDAAAAKIADIVLRRTWANMEASSHGDTLEFRSLGGAIAKLVNKIQVNGSNLEIMRDDDTTVLGTQVMTTNASAEPITALDTT